MSDKIFALIPGYQPTEALIRIAREMRENGAEVVVVDDGSGESWQNVFEEVKACATVLSYEKNRGKGYALKHGLEYIQSTGEAGVVVTLDADGQHTMKDSFAVAECALKNRSEGRECVVLGVRTFGKGTPFKSRAGNWITKWIYRFVSGCRVSDTQTGLRAFSTDLIPFMLTVSGERYEYEMNVLTACPDEEIPFEEVPIETIYEDNNSGSHFRPVRDSIRIYKGLLMFSLSSFIGFLTDFIVYTILVFCTAGLGAVSVPISNVVARVISAIVNFAINRHFVFKSKDSVWKTGAQYFVLAACILVGSTALISLLVNVLHFNKFIAKILTEITFFIVSWMAQKFIIFKKKK